VRKASLGVPRKRTAAEPPAVAQLYRAFADPTRLRILHLLRGRELCVGDLVTVLRVPQARTSRHLTYLRRAALVSARRDGLWIHYSLASARGRVHKVLLKSLAACARELPQIAADEDRYGALRKAGGCCPR
jgi:ArsR family transcriptional regulator, arsenate/arsenite/antimonite-responsive transcriptional repressor